jgi:hypothetical protein
MQRTQVSDQWQAKPGNVVVKVLQTKLWLKEIEPQTGSCLSP